MAAPTGPTAVGTPRQTKHRQQPAAAFLILHREHATQPRVVCVARQTLAAREGTGAACTLGPYGTAGYRDEAAAAADDPSICTDRLRKVTATTGRQRFTNRVEYLKSRSGEMRALLLLGASLLLQQVHQRVT
jgi:hypothetical protein